MNVPAPDGLDSLVSTAEAAYIAGVKSGTIRTWKSRGLLAPAGLDDRGHPLYRVRDVAKAERKTRNRNWGAK